MRITIDGNGDNLHPIRLTEREISLLGSLVTHHIRNLEGLLDDGQIELPEHKKWFYELEDKLDELIEM